ncbi:restriction endonuclease subunit S [Shewanella frigidimarina]|uniref:restriction endonuclease subunit S n=1 Tax=Shewanella frigidimarina TaxID=56812 RepID=UPI003FA1810B
MISYWLDNQDVREQVYIPKYYDPGIEQKIHQLKGTHNLFTISDLVKDGKIKLSTGHEIGKMAYGTGDIPFVRTSDLTNWETKSAPKQGVSEEIYAKYASSQDIQSGDILFVRDGTYLIGTNCIVTELDKKIVYQSHILKIRVSKEFLDPYLLFIILNSPLIQEQIRSFQFTADTIDTIGSRFQELVIPIPKDNKRCIEASVKAKAAMNARELGKAFIKQAPVVIEQVLELNTTNPIDEFLTKDWDSILLDLKQDTVTSEFGHFETFWVDSKNIKERIYLPKYYDPEIIDELSNLSSTCDCVSIQELCNDNFLTVSTGDEIGKMAYGTGIIPFVRTSDFSNWELKHDPKQGVSDEIYESYKKSQDVKAGDILLVRDGTYLIGTSCIITSEDEKMLFCGGLYKIRVNENDSIDQWLLLALLNSYLVKRQIRTKQFTRDVIDTIGKRLFEVVLPIPKSKKVRTSLSHQMKSIVESRINARVVIKRESNSIC